MGKYYTDSSKNDILKRYLSVLCDSYSTGVFEKLFPLLSDEVVYESQWVMTALEGKAAVEEYFLGKGATLRENNCCPECEIVALVGNYHPVKNADIQLAGGGRTTGSVGLLYPDGKLCMYMSQTLQDKTNGVIVDLTLDDSDKIARIDLCMPELFSFERYDEP